MRGSAAFFVGLVFALARTGGAQSPPGASTSTSTSTSTPAPAAAAPLPGALPTSLAPVPRFQLTLPAPVLVTQEGPGLWFRYWLDTSVPREWRDVPDDELRLNLETGRWQLGRLAASTELSSVPGRERDCEPDCRGAAWSSSLRLKYGKTDIGPLRETGPELKLQGSPSRSGVRGGGLLQGGFSGKF